MKGKIELGHLLWKDNKNQLIFPYVPPVELPLYEAILISEDGKTILRINEKPYMEPQSFNNFYWLNEQGREVGSLVNHYSDDVAVSLSEDGYTALGGRMCKDRSEHRVGLYSPQGKNIWENVIEKGLTVREVLVDKGGKLIAAVMCDAGNPLENNFITILHKNGAMGVSIHDWGVINRIFLLDDGRLIFIHTANNFGLVDMISGKTIWKKLGNLMMSTSGPRMSTNGNDNIIFLLVPDPIEEKRSAMIRGYRIRIINGYTGDTILEEYLPGKIGIADRPVIQEISSTKLQILFGNLRLNYAWANQRIQP